MELQETTNHPWLHPLLCGAFLDELCKCNWFKIGVRYNFLNLFSKCKIILHLIQLIFIWLSVTKAITKCKHLRYSVGITVFHSLLCSYIAHQNDTCTSFYVGLMLSNSESLVKIHSKFCFHNKLYPRIVLWYQLNCFVLDNLT